jgi:hypothetical protein
VNDYSRSLFLQDHVNHGIKKMRVSFFRIFCLLHFVQRPKELSESKLILFGFWGEKKAIQASNASFAEASLMTIMQRI